MNNYLQQIKVGPQERTKTYINVNVPPYIHHPHHLQQQTLYQQMYMQGLDSTNNPYGTKELINNSYATKGFTTNTFPQTFRETNFMLPENSLTNKHNILGNSVTSEVDDLIQTNKMPRETDSNQLSPEKEGESREKGKAMLLDGRRNTRSNKEESTEQKQQLTKK